VQGNLVYLAGGDLDIVDVSNPAAPKRAAQYIDASIVAVSGDTVYIVGSEGFSILRLVKNAKQKAKRKWLFRRICG
jgi:hypothetical protein